MKLLDVIIITKAITPPPRDKIETIPFHSFQQLNSIRSRSSKLLLFFRAGLTAFGGIEFRGRLDDRNCAEVAFGV